MEIVRKVRLRWFAHVLRTYSGYIRQRMLEMELPGSMKGERGPQRGFTVVMKEGMKMVGVPEEVAA